MEEVAEFNITKDGEVITTSKGDYLMLKEIYVKQNLLLSNVMLRVTKRFIK